MDEAVKVRNWPITVNYSSYIQLWLALAMFKPDEAACLLAERFNMIGWIYKQEPITFNWLASRLAALPTWTRPLT